MRYPARAVSLRVPVCAGALALPRELQRGCRQGSYEEVGFKLRLGLKDVRLVLEAAEAAEVPMPLASLVRDNLLSALALGKGDLDLCALAEVSAERAGLPTSRRSPDP